MIIKKGLKVSLVFKEESYAIRGAIFEVYKELGSGFLEAIYQECLEKEFQDRGVPFVSQPILQVKYKGVKLEQFYKPDFICYNKIIIELKAVKEIIPEHRAQLINYLKISELKLGVLVNFCAYPKVDVERYVI